jgi:two-component system nitrate/nitrite response regulator NarL
MANMRNETISSPALRPRLLVVAKVRIHREAFVEAMGRHRAVRVVGAVAPDLVLHSLDALEPDVVVVDVAELGTRERLAQIVSAARDIPVIAVGVPPVETVVLACAEAGASGLIPEDASFNDFIKTLANAASADAPDSTVVAEILLRRLRFTTQEISGPRAQGLSRREREILQLIARDLSNKEIAALLQLSVPTVKNHVQSILKKLGVRRRADAAAWLRRTAAVVQD